MPWRSSSPRLRLPGLRRARPDRRRLRAAACRRRSAESRRGRALRSCTRKRRTTSRSTGRSRAATSTLPSLRRRSSSRDRIIQQRLIPTAMEPRGAVAQFTPATGELTLWNTTQNPHIVRFIMSVVTGVPEDRLRVVAPEVGGGFGSKIPQIQGDFITAFCSMKLGRPVKWIETRSENYQSTTHGRDHVQEVELAATKDGRILGLRCTRLGRHGRVSLDRGAGHPDHPARVDAVGTVPGAGGERRRVRRLHEHHAGRSVSWRRPSRSHLHARADARSARAQDRGGPGRSQDDAT